jgi:hypothetical protein
LSIEARLAHSCLMGTKSRESIYGSSIRHSTERAAEARKDADRLACVAWNQRMLGYKRPAQASPALGDALNAGYPLAAEGRGPLMHARVGVLRALNRNVERVFNPDRKEPHWGKRKLKRDE